MTVHVTSWVLRNSRATLGSRLVLLVLADYADEDGGSCWPSVATISKETLLSERQVRYALRNLEQLGEIAIEQMGGGRRSTRYRVLMGGVQNLPPSDNGRGAVHCPPEGQPIAPDPPVEPPVKKPSASKDEIDAVWDTLTDIFGPVTTRKNERARGMIVQELLEAGAVPDEIVRRAKSWPSHFDSAPLTQFALVKWWDTLGRKPLRRQ